MSPIEAFDRLQKTWKRENHEIRRSLDSGLAGQELGDAAWNLRELQPTNGWQDPSGPYDAVADFRTGLGWGGVKRPCLRMLCTHGLAINCFHLAFFLFFFSLPDCASGGDGTLIANRLVNRVSISVFPHRASSYLVPEE